MKPEIQEIIDAWKLFCEKISKYKPSDEMAILCPNYEPFKIVRINGEYILEVDLSIFDEKK